VEKVHQRGRKEGGGRGDVLFDLKWKGTFFGGGGQIDDYVLSRGGLS